MGFYDEVKTRRDKGHNLSNTEVAWVQDYATGLHQFVDEHAEQALNRFNAGDATGTIVEARKIVDMPDRKERILHTLTSSAIVCALRGATDTEAVKLNESVRVRVPEAVSDVLSYARLVMYGRETIEWAQALSLYTDSYDFHGAAISALELADAQASPATLALNPSQLGSYEIATNSARHYMDQLSGDARDAAEKSSVKTHLLAGLEPVARDYAAKSKVRGSERDHAMRTIYEIDDLTNLSDQSLQNFYSLLERSSHLKERKFFKQEASSAAGRIWVKEFFRTHTRQYLAGGPDTRRPPRDQRPLPRS